MMKVIPETHHAY